MSRHKSDFAAAESRELELTCSGRHEAEQLFRMVVIGNETIEGIRDLIDVPARYQTVLLAAARAGISGRTIAAALDFRVNVRRHFDALVAARVGPETFQ